MREWRGGAHGALFVAEAVAERGLVELVREVGHDGVLLLLRDGVRHLQHEWLWCTACVALAASYAVVALLWVAQHCRPRAGLWRTGAAALGQASAGVQRDAAHQRRLLRATSLPPVLRRVLRCAARPLWPARGSALWGLAGAGAAHSEPKCSVNTADQAASLTHTLHPCALSTPASCSAVLRADWPGRRTARLTHRARSRTSNAAPESACTS